MDLFVIVGVSRVHIEQHGDLEGSKHRERGRLDDGALIPAVQMECNSELNLEAIDENSPALVVDSDRHEYLSREFVKTCFARTSTPSVLDSTRCSMTPNVMGVDDVIGGEERAGGHGVFTPCSAESEASRSHRRRAHVVWWVPLALFGGNYGACDG